VEQKNIFLARLQWSSKSSGSDDTNYAQVLARVRRFENSHRFLVAAASKEEKNTVKALLDQGVDSNVQNRGGQSALHIAVQNGNLQVVRLLLGKGSADIALQDNKGQSALHFAVQRALRFAGQVDEFQRENSKDELSLAKEVIELLLAKGVDAKATDKHGRSATDLASQNKEIELLLEDRRLLEGPSESIKDEWRMPTPPDDPNVSNVCRNFRATLTEFFLIEGKERRSIEHASVYDVLYGQGPESILNDARPSIVKEKRTCRWFHLPANNTAWINDLFVRLKILDDSMTEGQHEGFTPHSRHMRPQVRKIEAKMYPTDTNPEGGKNANPEDGKNADPEDGKNDQRSKAQSEADFIRENSVVVFMPYLNYEYSRERRAISEELKKVTKRKQEEALLDFYNRPRRTATDATLSEAGDDPKNETGDHAQPRKETTPQTSRAPPQHPDPGTDSESKVSSTSSGSEGPDEPRTSLESNRRMDGKKLQRKREEKLRRQKLQEKLRLRLSDDINLISSYLDYKFPLHVSILSN
jgi:hypothetical protein